MGRTKQPLPEFLNSFYAHAGGWDTFQAIVQNHPTRLRSIEVAHTFKVSENTARSWLGRYEEARA